MENINKIRNFCIIAHIDHGKSTLADRLLEKTQTIKITEGQMLDDMDLERERGITIKSHAIQMEYKAKDGDTYILNLIDTPGHVDFSYEVSRSIAACEGALLVVDATQGVQAQTISNLYMAIEHDLEIIPVINKIDMPSAMPEEVEDEIVDLIGCKHEDILRASGKTGEGVEDVLEAVVNRVPAPKGDDKAPLQALIFDSVFNSFRGIIAYFKIENGVIRKGDKVKFFNTGMEYDADEIGVLKMDMIPRKELGTGEVGYIISGIKNATEVKVGDTITHIARPCEKAIAGFQEVERFLHGVGFKYTVGYGATECAPIICYEDYKNFVPGSCGKAALHMMVRIDSPDPENVPGEILAKGPNVMLGYYKNEEATRQTIDENGWYHSGDLGTMDGDGNVFIKGRSKNMLLGASGQNIYPEEIEDKLNSLALVAESVVIQRGNKLVALVYPDFDEAQSLNLGRSELEEIMEQNRQELNAMVPAYSKVSEIRIHDEEFEKTPKKSIKRFLYTAE